MDRVGRCGPSLNFPSLVLSPLLFPPLFFSSASLPLSTAATHAPPSPVPSIFMRLYKVAARADASAWKEAGKLTGSDLDLADGFIHTSDYGMCQVVAERFFSGRDDLVLLVIDLAPLAPLVVEGFEALELGEESEASTVVQTSPDGCAHVFRRPGEELPMSLVTELPLPLGGDGKHAFPRGLGEG